MTPNTYWYAYYTNIERYVRSLPLWRRVLAHFFEKYKVTKKEYDEWFYTKTG